ncbi:MAG TPA: MtrB/PioB family decaheme-associated outer membrane protein [Burkholderiales bacterium]|nr:MtrB/PioB family decaheme-associated outer membrane protein [Burkholderiales bacterium]
MAMKTRNEKVKASAIALAVQGVLIAMAAVPARAQDTQLGSLRAPPNFVELGVATVSKDSYKFGEYTGLVRSGAYLIGNFDVRGGDAYADGNGTRRWQLIGTDLGLTSRSLAATVGDQGRWTIGVGFDQLTHYTSDSYQTPYTGSMGGNSFTLPSFGTAANARTLSAAQLGQFQTMKISNERENTSASGTLIIDPRWSVKLEANHLEQSGAKLMAFGAAAISGATGERPAILPMPTNYTTDTVNLALNWLGSRSNATLSYFGSYFQDNYNGVRFTTWAGANVNETMGTPPSSQFHQLNFTGGYALSARTKLAGGLSYGYNRQDMVYAYDNIVPTVMVTPAPTTSLDGVVKTSHADLKITDQTTRNLILSGGFKYDYRDNQTASNIYNYNAISGGNTANYPNAPLSYKKEQAELAGDYRLSTSQKLRLAYNHDDTHRFCNQYASGGGTPPYAPGTNCVTVPRTKEDKLGVLYRLRAADGLNLNASYSFSNRRSDRDLTARAPMIGLDGNAVVAPALPGVGTPAGITGINGGEFRGFNPFFEASRKQNMLKAGANWEAADRLSLGLNGRLTVDNYGTDFGMQRGKSWSLNADGTYRYHENGTITAYWTQQERIRDLTNQQRSPTTTPTAPGATTIGVPSGATWSNAMKDSDSTIGVGVKHGGFMGGRLDLLGDALYSYTRTEYSTVLNYSTTDASGRTCADPFFLTCVPTPLITNKLFQFKISGLYQVTKQSTFKLGYLYQHLTSDDFIYNGMQTGFTPTAVLPTNQRAPSYSVNVVYASLIYNF